MSTGLLSEACQAALQTVEAVGIPAPAMVPVVFSGGGAGCFGWLHGAPLGGDVAVLICAALNRDALDSHHGMRLLADDLAASGYPCLRFDYPGIGHSCDLTAASPEHWAAWQRSVDDAADWLRTATGASRVVFCGLRIGATLAALAATARRDAAGLLLLAPVLRGRSYMRQLQIEAQLLAQRHDSSEAGPGDGLEFHELHLSAATVAAIAGSDLRRLQPALPVALYAQAPSLLVNECVAAWTASGAAVASRDFAGLAPLLQHNLVEDCAPPDFSDLLAWLRAAVPPVPAARVGTFHRAPQLQPPGCRETPLRFGPEGRLFGMLCQPEGSGNPDLPAVIIGNLGRDPSYGFARFGVELARRLAASGIASLRMDFSGLGDSAGAAGRERVHSHMFEVDRTPDLIAAVDLLGQFGYRRIAVEGICAGAYHALHGALADPRITTLLLVNLPVFEWRIGDTVDFVNRRTAAPGPFLAKLFQAELWRRLARGEVHVRRFLHAQAVRLHALSRGPRHRLLRAIGMAGPRSIAHTALAVLADRGARTLFLFAPDDSGLDAFELEFGRQGKGMSAFPGAELEVMPAIDHELSTASMRQAATARIIRFLTGTPSLPS